MMISFPNYDEIFENVNKLLNQHRHIDDFYRKNPTNNPDENIRMMREIYNKLCVEIDKLRKYNNTIKNNIDNKQICDDEDDYDSGYDTDCLLEDIKRFNRVNYDNDSNNDDLFDYCENSYDCK